MTVSLKSLFLGFVVILVVSLTALSFWTAGFAVAQFFEQPKWAGWVFFGILMLIWTECRSVLYKILGIQEGETEEAE